MEVTVHREGPKDTLTSGQLAALWMCLCGVLSVVW